MVRVARCCKDVKPEFYNYETLLVMECSMKSERHKKDIWKMIKIEAPFTKDKLKKLKAGDKILLSGVIYTARDPVQTRRRHFQIIISLDGILPV